MRLNVYQKEWIDRLKSGKSHKKERQLFGSRTNSNCCLGVAAMVCHDKGLCEINRSCVPTDLSEVAPVVVEKLKITFGGEIDTTKVKKKWVEYFDKKGYDYNSLISLNDETHMSHREIGNFINENRSAVFSV